MRTMPAMVDMAITPKEAEEECSPMCDPSQGPRYPYGLCLSLGQDELDKLQLSASEVEVGDVVHIMAFAKVTSVSSSETQEGSSSRVELQIIALASEDEDTEEADDQPKSNPVKSFYG